MKNGAVLNLVNSFLMKNRLPTGECITAGNINRGTRNQCYDGLCFEGKIYSYSSSNQFNFYVQIGKGR